jgi:hypothetical protein
MFAAMFSGRHHVEPDEVTILQALMLICLPRLFSLSLAYTVTCVRVCGVGTQDGFYFVDRDGTHFIHILNFLRDGTLNIPDDRFLYNWLINEANFYSLPDLDKLCRKALKHKEKLVAAKE